VDEDFLTLNLVMLGKGTIDRALRQRKAATVRVGVVDDVVERPIKLQHFGEGVARKSFGRSVHVNALLPLIHEDDRHRSVVQHRLKAAMRVVQRVGCLRPNNLIQGSPQKTHHHESLMTSLQRSLRGRSVIRYLPLGRPKHQGADRQSTVCSPPKADIRSPLAM
jgi:hypothetical protein